jgi:hypothetical protein
MSIVESEDCNDKAPKTKVKIVKFPKKEVNEGDSRTGSANRFLISVL